MADSKNKKQRTDREPNSVEIADWKDLQRNFSVLYPQAPGKCPTGLTRLQKMAAYAISMGWSYPRVSQMLGKGAHKKTIELWATKANFIEFVDACAYVNPLHNVNEFLKTQVLGAAAGLAATAKSDDPNIKQDLKQDAQKTILRHAIGDPEQRTAISIIDVMKQISTNAKKQIHKDTDKSGDTGTETRSDSELKIH